MKPNAGIFFAFLPVLIPGLAAASSTVSAPAAATTLASSASTAPAGSSASPPVTAIPAPRETVVAFEDALPAPYRLERVRIWVDGALRYDGPPPMGVPLTRGDHLVSIAADYRLSDPVFSYMRGYRIEVRASRHVPGSGDGRVVLARAIEAGGVTTPFDRRARIVWR